MFFIFFGGEGGEPRLYLHLIIVICGDSKAVKNSICTVDMSASWRGGGINESDIERGSYMYRLSSVNVHVRVYNLK